MDRDQCCWNFHANEYPNTYFYLHANCDLYFYTNTYQYPDSNRDTYANSYSHIHTNGNACVCLSQHRHFG